MVTFRRDYFPVGNRATFEAERNVSRYFDRSRKAKVNFADDNVKLSGATTQRRPFNVERDQERRNEIATNNYWSSKFWDRVNGGRV